jgi:hypothetical protein
MQNAKLRALGRLWVARANIFKNVWEAKAEVVMRLRDGD